MLTGSAAMSLAVPAVAATGFAMLSGRIDWQRGFTVVLDRFILFGAPLIAGELMALVHRADPQVPLPPPPAWIPPPTDLPPFDPYAGTALPGSGGRPE